MLYEVQWKESCWEAGMWIFRPASLALFIVVAFRFYAYGVVALAEWRFIEAYLLILYTTIPLGAALGTVVSFASVELRDGMLVGRDGYMMKVEVPLDDVVGYRDVLWLGCRCRKVYCLGFKSFYLPLKTSGLAELMPQIDARVRG